MKKKKVHNLLKTNIRIDPLLLLLSLSLSLWMTLSPVPLLAQNQSGITSPSSGDSVSGDVVVSGTAVIDPFLRYELYYKLEPSGDDAYIYFDGGTTQVTNGQLGIWRTTDLAPGTYSLRLRVVKTDGNYGEFIASNLSLNVNTEPTATPTSSEPTATPIPTITFTPAPQPTAIVGQVTQPQIEGQAPTPTPTPLLILDNNGNSNTTDGGNADGAVAAADAAGDTSVAGEDTVTFEESTTSNSTVATTNSFTRQLGEAIAIERLREYFATGMRFSAALILGIALLFAGKWAFRWVWTQYR